MFPYKRVTQTGPGTLTTRCPSNHVKLPPSAFGLLRRPTLQSKIGGSVPSFGIRRDRFPNNVDELETHAGPLQASFSGVPMRIRAKRELFDILGKILSST
jgi:hypothetical protein